MMFRTVIASLLLSTSVAAADDELVPSCVEIDEARDTQSPEERAVALATLTRVLEDGDVLVVTDGCVDHYLLSQFVEADNQLIVRLAGPDAARRMRNPALDRLPAAYAQLLAAVRTATASEPEASAEPLAIPDFVPAPVESRDEIDEGAVPEDGSAADVRTRGIYGAFQVGTYGPGIALGYRYQYETATLDVRFSGAGGDDRSSVAIGARVLRFTSTGPGSSGYIGGGLSVAGEHEYEMSGGGVRAEGVVGYAFARKNYLFVQAEFALPTYQVGDAYSPSLMLSLGLGR